MQYGENVEYAGMLATARLQASEWFLFKGWGE